MPLLVRALVNRNAHQVRGAARDIDARQKTRHIRAFDRARAGRNADRPNRCSGGQSGDHFMQMQGVLKQRIRLPQSERTRGNVEQTTAVLPLPRLGVKQRG